MTRTWICVAVMFFVGAEALAQTGAPNGEWPYYGGDQGQTKYSPLAQIDASNVNELEVAWTWESADAMLGDATTQQPGAFKATPIMVDGTLYVSTGMQQMAAVDPATGTTLWVHDPQAYALGRPTNSGWQHRGVSYWTDGEDARIVILTGTLQLVAVNAKTGATYETFGNGGWVDLTQGLAEEVPRRYVGNNAPVAIVGDTIVTGSTIFDRPTGPEMPAGHVRGFDVRTGEQKWVFHTIPQEGAFGNETWEEGSWKYSGGVNVWAPMTVDPELGYVYLPVSTPTNDYYGGHRKGDNLFAESIVCLDGATGERVWHFQAVHHGLWDYDFPAAPTLCDITVDGEDIKAVAAASKQGFVYVFDRETGEPVWPIEDRPVRQSTVPGEQTSPTQPFPTKPPAFVRQGVTEDDLVDFTPEIKAEALEIAGHYILGPLYTPPSVLGENGNRGVIQVPSAAGGANWGGTAFDPETGMLYLQAANIHSLAHVRPGNKDRGVMADYLTMGPLVAPGPQGLPLLKPPYAVVVGMDLNAGDIAWSVPHGDGPRDHPAIAHLELGPLGASSHGMLSSGGPLLTKTLLFINQAQIDLMSLSVSDTGLFMRAYDKRNGDVLWEERLVLPPYGTPMTYMHAGRQYIVVACGGARQPARLVAYALPD